ncbi:hypothetical protein CONPUDRAFT_108026 [Coniophora puteana RWD-64-598 SS2]|uniref:MYND-type domain-containing protein n=1 Tax=Coniophora puteana (strain RWD-64-598) TaxID=741705 RepID=A0A5M3MGU8_CONPW|nr:uncharacterized protein CONPUDRAFT_108026 [Coniophora puteana RWD-64-598 SS2]EIW78226.1 hypothetical protein CONPUDRAFT_108026 [Coniophora puteana RWD-64-598 SS2]
MKDSPVNEDKVFDKARHRCNNPACYANGAEVKLFLCTGCRMAKYCSKTCQKEDWSNHRKPCKQNVQHEAALRNPLNPLNLLPLPDGLTPSELDYHLEKWIAFHHQPTLMYAVINALDLPSDISRANTHILRIRLSFRMGHINTHRADPQRPPPNDRKETHAKDFVVVTAEAITMEEARKLRAPWPESIADLQSMQIESERNNRGSIAVAAIEAFPLGMQCVPCGSLRASSLKTWMTDANWKATLIDQVQKGEKLH